MMDTLSDYAMAMSSTPQCEIIQFNNALGGIRESVGAGIYPAVLNFVGVFRQNLPQIESAAMGFVSALGAYKIAQIVSSAAEWLSTGSKISNAIATGASTVALNGQEIATNKASMAQWGLNAALLASPITWIVIGVIALIAAVAALSSWIAKTTGAAQTGFGIITGSINVAIAFFKNLGLAVANIALGIGAAMGALGTNIKAAFHNAINKVQGWFYGLLSTALTVVAGICAALNQLPSVEFDYSGITGKAEEYAAKSEEAYGNEEEYVSISDAFTEAAGKYDAFADGWKSDAFEDGADGGDGIMDKVNGFFDGLGYEPGSIEDYTFDTSGFDIGNIGPDVECIADNTGGMAGTLEVSGEEMKYLRDIAERDAINRFTAAEVKIDMSGMSNRIEGGADLDGVIRELTEGFTGALVTAAEGVHE